MFTCPAVDDVFCNRLRRLFVSLFFCIAHTYHVAREMDDRSVVLQPWTLVSKVILLPRTNVYFNDHYTCCLTMAVHTDDHRLSVHTASVRQHRLSPQWGAADAEIKIPSVENTELEGSPFKAWGRLVYSRTCYAYCQGFLPG